MIWSDELESNIDEDCNPVPWPEQLAGLSAADYCVQEIQVQADQIPVCSSSVTS